MGIGVLYTWKFRNIRQGYTTLHIKPEIEISHIDGLHMKFYKYLT